MEHHLKTKRPLYSTKEKVHWSRQGNWWSEIKIEEHVERTDGKKKNKKRGVRILIVLMADVVT